jgi:hypothetical protein
MGLFLYRCPTTGLPFKALFACEADVCQLRKSEGGYFLGQGGGVDHGSIDNRLKKTRPGNSLLTG